jgi:hypothetical protein
VPVENTLNLGPVGVRYPEYPMSMRRAVPASQATARQGTERRSRDHGSDATAAAMGTSSWSAREPRSRRACIRQAKPSMRATHNTGRAQRQRPVRALRAPPAKRNSTSESVQKSSGMQRGKQDAASGAEAGGAGMDLILRPRVISSSKNRSTSRSTREDEIPHASPPSICQADSRQP